MVVKVVCGIGKGGKDYDFAVASIYWVGDFFVNLRKKRIQLVVVLGRDVVYHRKEQVDVLDVVFKFFAPRGAVDVGKLVFHFAPYGEKVAVAVVCVELRLSFKLFHFEQVSRRRFFKAVDYANCLFVECFYALKRETERINRAFKTLQKPDSRKAVDSFFAVALGEAHVCADVA